MHAFDATVSGRVQLVRFRSFVFRHARALGVVGMVENMPDGSVHIIAEGDKAKLDELLMHVNRGPFLARVQEVRVEWKEPSSVFDGFSIKNPWTV